jgi:hypothetical protein
MIMHYNFTGGVGVAGTGTAAITVGFNGSITPSGKIGSNRFSQPALLVVKWQHLIIICD